MKKLLLAIALGVFSFGAVNAQTKKPAAKKEATEKKETKEDVKEDRKAAKEAEKNMTEEEKREAFHEREKERWTKVGNYWKGKHEEKVARDSAREKEGKERKGPPRPPSPKRKKQTEE